MAVIFGFAGSKITKKVEQITTEDIYACIAYGAARSRGRIVPVASEPVA